ncbi:hypothetical protein PENTCL1PPCAC_15627, partial [Pristionchus entomophagus]
MENRRCLFCTVPISVTHLGIDACRACAAFFKRTVIAGRRYPCRRGDKKCVIRKHEKFMCRSCRYDRCIELEMTYMLPPKKKPRKNREVKVDAEMIPSTSSSASSMTPATPMTYSLPTKRRSRMTKDESTNLELTSTSCLASDSLLDRTETEYKSWCERRLVQEMGYIAKHNLQPFDHPTEKFYITHFTSYYDLFRIAMKEAFPLLQNVFHDFKKLPHRFQVTLFKNYINKFSKIECIYYTKKHFKNRNTMLMASLMTCMEKQNVHDWLIDTNQYNRKEAFRTTCKGFMDEYDYLFGTMTQMDEITDREFYALSVLSYCDIDTSLHVSEEIVKNAQATRGKVFEELQEYYRTELKLHDFSHRLGNLMAMIQGASEAARLMNKEMQMYSTMFDIYSDDSFFREIFSE